MDYTFDIHCHSVKKLSFRFLKMVWLLRETCKGVFFCFILQHTYEVTLIKELCVLTSFWVLICCISNPLVSSWLEFSEGDRFISETFCGSMDFPTTCIGLDVKVVGISFPSNSNGSIIFNDSDNRFGLGRPAMICRNNVFAFQGEGQFIGSEGLRDGKCNF